MSTKRTPTSENLTPGKHLMQQIRGGLILRGSNFNRWCREHDVLRPTAYKAIVGERNGPKAEALRERLAIAAGVL